MFCRTSWEKYELKASSTKAQINVQKASRVTYPWEQQIFRCPVDEFNQVNYLTMQTTTQLQCTVYVLQILKACCHVMEKDSGRLVINGCSNDASTGEFMIKKVMVFTSDGERLVIVTSAIHVKSHLNLPVEYHMWRIGIITKMCSLWNYSISHQNNKPQNNQFCFTAVSSSQILN